MPKSVLTDVSLRALKPPRSGQITVWDASSPLGIRVSQGGSKTFIVIVGSGQRRTIGRFPIIGLSDARSEAKRIIAEHTLGIAKKPTAMTFEVARTIYIDQKQAKPRTIKEAKRVLEKHFRPLCKMPLSEVTDAEIQKQLEPERARRDLRSLRLPGPKAGGSRQVGGPPVGSPTRPSTAPSNRRMTAVFFFRYP
jgi:hypothetical protein